MIQGFSEFLIQERMAQPAGKLELANISVDQARDFAEGLFISHGRNLDTEIPKFNENFEVAKRNATRGIYQRKDMPVIPRKEVKQFQKRLATGSIDLTAPFAPDTDPMNPFPDGLSGETAKGWLENGLKVHDGKRKDDMVKTKIKEISVNKLNASQRQIYFDKSIFTVANQGVKASKKFLTSDKSILVVSNDNFIIDGHHRFLSAILVDSKLKVQCLVVDLPVEKLLRLSLSYGDAMGHPRNH